MLRLYQIGYVYIQPIKRTLAKSDYASSSLHAPMSPMHSNTTTPNQTKHKNVLNQKHMDSNDMEKAAVFTHISLLNWLEQTTSKKSNSLLLPHLNFYLQEKAMQNRSSISWRDTQTKIRTALCDLQKMIEACAQLKIHSYLFSP